MKEYDCPYNKCDGKLEEQWDLSTSVGYFKLDQNRKEECFKCTVCKRKVIRSFKWKEFK